MATLADLAAAAAARWSSIYSVTVPPELVLAIIGIESHGDTNAVGAAGELGLMQVMPDTARALGLADPHKLATPEIGVDYGTKYLAQQLERYAGKIPHAVAAYNAGSARFTQGERFVNQSYVDKVIARFLQIVHGNAPLAWIGAAAVAGVALWIVNTRRS
jgi:soluble lytic murein transglycosylase-like protein